MRSLVEYGKRKDKKRMRMKLRQKEKLEIERVKQVQNRSLRKWMGRDTSSVKEKQKLYEKLETNSRESNVRRGEKRKRQT